MKTKTAISSGLALMAIAAGMLTACSSSEAKDGMPEKTPAPVSNVISLQKEKFTTAIQIPGELTAYRQVDIYAKENSYVKTLLVDVGSQVHTGQLLMTLEAPELTSQLLNAESRWKALYAIFIASNANYDRMFETSKTAGTISPNDLDLAAARKNSDSAQYVAAKATYKEIAQLLDYLEIRAPFDGIISARNVNLGAYVGPSGMGSTLPIFTLQQQKHLRLIVSIPEAYTGHLKENDLVSFSVKAFPDKTFQARVARMAGALDIRLRAEHVEMDVDNSDKKLLPGMVAEVKLSLDGEDSTYVVPQTAIVNTTVHPFVIRINNNTVEWVDIKTGRTYKGKVEVYGALRPNETLVKVASEEIRNGANWNQ